MVTSLKMSENEMDNRGSKSTIIQTSLHKQCSDKVNNIVVKEQRVNGFLQKNLTKKKGFFFFAKFSCIRYTLMGFERNYQVKIPFNQILQRGYSTSSNDNNVLTP